MRRTLSQIPEKLRAVFLIGLLVALCCSGVWSVSHYFNQDGTAHLYNAYLMGEILKGNEQILQFASLNPQPVPNQTGHWLLALFLPVFGAAIATKLMVTLTFALFVSAIVWLRVQVAGNDRRGLVLAALMGCVLAFNWLWFLGFYNFILAAAGFAFGLGLWWRWRMEMNAFRAACLAAVFVLTFLSHLVSFGLLVGAVFTLAALNFRTLPRASLLWTLAAGAATAPLILSYLVTSRDVGSFSPRWSFVTDILSPGQWVTQTISADPFALISRKSFPFVEASSSAFTAFTPLVWLLLAICILIGGMVLSRRSSSAGSLSDSHQGWFLLAILFILVWLFGPDDLGKSHGGYLRERTLILGLVCLLPWLDIRRLSKRSFAAAAFCLTAILVYQTAVVWEYAARSNGLAEPFLSAGAAIANNDAFGSIIVIDEPPRFRAQPLFNLTPLVGIGKNAAVWDNYEFGYNLFPVVASSTEMRKFVYDFRESNTFDLRDLIENQEAKRRDLDGVLAREHSRFRVLLVWNDQPEIAAIRNKWFEERPFFEAGDLQLFRHR
ncbi:MAG: hypothetical protein ABI481_03060 [Pyrinomonadaceae bacterium]